MTSRALLLSLALTLTLACNESEPPLLDALGDPCRSPYDRCLDENSVQTCEAGVWVERDCASVCAELGPAYGPAGCEQECVCELLDPSGCTPGEATCMDEGTVAVCDEAQVLQPSACAELCAAAGLEELGCLEVEGEAGCWCTSEGSSCEPSSLPACIDDATIAECQAGIWTFVECETICGGPATCDPFQQPAMCSC